MPRKIQNIDFKNILNHSYFPYFYMQFSTLDQIVHKISKLKWEKIEKKKVNVFDIVSGHIDSNINLYQSSCTIILPYKIKNIINLNNDDIYHIQFNINIYPSFCPKFNEIFYTKINEHYCFKYINQIDDDTICVKLNKNCQPDQLIKQKIFLKINLFSVQSSAKGPNIHIPIIDIHDDILYYDPVIEKKKFIYQNSFSLTIFDNLNIANIISILSIGLIGIAIGNSIMNKPNHKNNNLSNDNINKLHSICQKIKTNFRLKKKI